ncbi:cytochrome b/b6 domain-containing protein [Hydrogenophaga laconesensis]|uniref:Cytochrome b n=1 Tax=Hydrogenophaga laconesensis TaxID=1805971 RepID=A0ABU1VIR2_9BURK|nr:cytochrome b/b6 domain-containing protein [Hydrogenophaga laconesensis]MDR7097368.1 cytochrome b [Hydrogenophaga laconesensis]
MHTIRVWDLPTRVFHWLLAASVIGLIVTGSVGGNWMNWHLRLGYAVLALLLFRLVWGFIGGHWSRFARFIYAPSSLAAYLRGRGRLEHQVGHTPLGALSVFALLLILLVQVGTGLISDDEISFFGPLVRFVSGETVSLATGYHKDIGKLIIIVLLALHVLAIAYYKWVKKQGLVRSMVIGDKQVPVAVPNARDTAGSRLLALVVLGLCAAAVTWLVSLGNAF